ncbi:MAG: class I SAM-dependent methyltransferase [Methanosarcinales archaeon]
MKYEEEWIKEVIRERWNRSAHRYDNSPGHGIHSEEEKEAWKNLLTQAIGAEKLNVLDVGCGTGTISLLLSEIGHIVTGIDISEGMLQKAKEKANILNLSINFRIGDAENLPFEDESFDVVINRHLLWTLPDPERAIFEWRRVLKSEGKLIIIDGSWGNYRRLHRQIWRYLISMPLILVTERRNPWRGHYGRDIEKLLPLRQRKRPEADIEIFKDHGFGVDVGNVKIPRNQTLLGYLKYGHWGDRGYFIVKGIKEDRKVM